MSFLLVVVGLGLAVATLYVLFSKSSTTAKTEQTSVNMSSATRVARKQRLTVEEVSAHDTEDDLWLIIDGKVYDFTTYVGNHPGGLSIMNNAGRDASEGFHGDQHPDRLEQMLDEFYVGDLDKTD